MPIRPTRRRGTRERFCERLKSSGRFPEVIVEGFNCDSTCAERRVNVRSPTRLSFRDGPKDQTSDVQLHIGNLEIPGSRFARPGMTKEFLMTAAAYALLFLGALAGGFVSGLAGFGTALMALGIWLYVVPPSLAVPLVLICSVVAQTSTMPSIWRKIDFRLVWPFLIGGLAGVPLGTVLIAHADPTVFKLTIGVFLLVFPALLYFQRKPM